MLPLSMAGAGTDAMVVRVSGSDAVKQHLADLGFVEGTPIRVVSAPGNGNVIVRLKESRLALASNIAAKVMVTMK